jgi:hypothetical protein
MDVGNGITVGKVRVTSAVVLERRAHWPPDCCLFQAVKRGIDFLNVGPLCVDFSVAASSFRSELLYSNIYNLTTVLYKCGTKTCR